MIRALNITVIAIVSLIANALMTSAHEGHLHDLKVSQICMFEDQQYSVGSFIVIGATEFRCIQIDNLYQWSSKEIVPGKFDGNCLYDGNKYSSGAIIVIDQEKKKCSKSVWID